MIGLSYRAFSISHYSDGRANANCINHNGFLRLYAGRVLCTCALKLFQHLAGNINSPHRLQYDCFNVSCENLMARLDYPLVDGFLCSLHLSALQSIDIIMRNEMLISSETTCESLSEPALRDPRYVFFKIQTTRQC